ncbi:hypothetical protein MMC07_001782 [Pseudocyphellaria aurata]|nr:hypothetical protein [Pseudocyphellaria aurata]
MQFLRKDKTLNFFKPGHPVHSYFTNSCDPEKPDSRPWQENRVLVDVEKDDEYWLKFAVGMPFIGFHFDNLTDPRHGRICRYSYLAIGISETLGLRSNVFIVQTDRDVPESQCKHMVDLEKGRRSTNWKAVALLAGCGRGTSSLGTVMAISPGGGRIAVATWDRVLVWTFDPSLLHEGSLEHYFPERDYNPKKGIGRLRPTKLSTEGVIHSMLWVDETNLYATTDKGLVQWDMGHWSDGEREDLSLAYDAWPETAVEMPNVNGNM